jgi:DNA-binding MarR family transcriptional regulator
LHFCGLQEIIRIEIVFKKTNLFYMKTISSIPILIKWEEFNRIKSEGSIEDFARWLLEGGKKPGIPIDSFGNNQLIQDKIDRAAQVSLLINRLNKLMGLFNKPIIRNMGFGKEHEFAVFAQVAISDKLNKKELANKTLLEVSTTVEITKRLAKKGLIKEEVDKTDRRSARISLTEKGQKLLMNNVRFFSAHLKEFLREITDDEQRYLIDLLNRLNTDNSDRLERLQNA